MKLKNKVKINGYNDVNKREKRTKLKEISGITIVALVITIIVLIMLAGVTISAILGEEGIIEQAKKAAQIHANAEAKENESLDSMLDQYVKVSEVYDSTGKIEDKLHIGDFINYDAGTWTEEEINSIKVGLKTNLISANNSLDLPEVGYQFGGFSVGSSRNDTSQIAPFNGLGTVEYIRNASNNKPISGWRVFDIDESTGKVTLISAGNPEAYFQSTESDSGYVSQYIFSGEINSSWSEKTAANYQIRDWSNYVNTEMKAESAYILSKSQLEAWYNKYVGSVTDLWTQSQFKLVYNYERL